MQADKTLAQKRDKDEATGEVQTLSIGGRLEGMKMGDMAKRTRPSQSAKKQEPEKYMIFKLFLSLV